MAQTIALQRGTTTVSAGGNTVVTLFTQSGGTATRVIINQLIVYFTSGPPGVSGNGMNLYLTSSGGYSSIIGQMKYESSGSMWAWQANTGAPNNGFNGTSPGTSNAINSANPFTFQSTSAGDMITGTTSQTYMQYSNTSFNAYCNFPANFYMGPSDALKLKVRGLYTSGKGTASGTANVGYSFTTITES
jgi:hypothetical protein